MRAVTSAVLYDAAEVSLLQGDSCSLSSSPTSFSWLPRTIIRVKFQNNLAGDMPSLIREKRDYTMKE